MRFAQLLSLSLSVSARVCSSPLAGRGNGKADEQSSIQSRDSSSCLSMAEAQQVATNWRQMITNYTDNLALAILTEDFQEHSSSTNYLVDSSCSNGLIPVCTLARLWFSGTDGGDSSTASCLKAGQQP